MKPLRILLAAALCSVGISCSKNKENKEYKSDEVNSVDRKASIETQLSVKHDSASDILITRHKIWKDGQLAKEITTYDTLPSLGDTLIEAAHVSGGTATGKTKRDYEFYITVQ